MQIQLGLLFIARPTHMIQQLGSVKNETLRQKTLFQFSYYLY